MGIIFPLIEIRLTNWPNSGMGKTTPLLPSSDGPVNVFNNECTLRTCEGTILRVQNFMLVGIFYIILNVTGYVNNTKPHTKICKWLKPTTTYSKVKLAVKNLLLFSFLWKWKSWILMNLDEYETDKLLIGIWHIFHTCSEFEIFLILTCCRNCRL